MKLTLCLYLTLISVIHAAPGIPAGFDPISLLPIVGIIAVFYFFILRPQQKKMKEHQRVIANLARGDKVLTTGGIIGEVYRLVSEQEVILEIADNVHVRFMRAMISEVLSAPTENSSAHVQKTRAIAGEK